MKNISFDFQSSHFSRHYSDVYFESQFKTLSAKIQIPSENFFYDFWTIVNISASWASLLVDVSYSNHFLICFELHRDKSQTRKIIWIFAPKVNIIHEICDHWLDFPQILGKFISPWFLLYHSEMARIFGGLEVGTLEAIARKHEQN